MVKLIYVIHWHNCSLLSAKQWGKFVAICSLFTLLAGWNFSNEFIFPGFILKLDKETLTYTHLNTKINDSDLEIYGKVIPSKKYITFGCCFPTNRKFDYLFYLPLTVMAWKRIGFESIVILTGNIHDWNKSQLARYVVGILKNLESIVIFMNSEKKNQISLSQTVRLFVAYLPIWHGLEETFLLTTDADLWPLKQDKFSLLSHKKILALNSECCGNIIHRNQSYKHLPMAHIGMNISLWREVMDLQVDPYSFNSEMIFEYLSKHFPDDLVRSPVKKGDAGWNMDETEISMNIQNWAKKHGSKHILYVGRQEKDRIDRVRWRSSTKNFGIKIDAHLPHKGFLEPNWQMLQPLLKFMYNDSKQKECERYRNNFLEKYDQMFR